MENKITLIGDVVSAPRESHTTSSGKKFYKFFIGVERRSGVADILPVLFDKEISDTGISGRVYVSGKIITRHVKTGSGKAILTYVMADTIKPKDDVPLNEVSLDGIIEEKQLRETPLGRKICDVKLKTLRENGKEDLITCITWGKCAEYTDSLALGDKVSAYGRLQSRRYKKTCKDGRVVEKVTYELSIKGIVGV
nr:MAG TPA: Single strand binding protein [Caudoviricetes sp.]